MFLVGLSSTRGLDRRLAINLAWEWAGLGFAYVLTRNLPRTRGESTVLAGALVATAVAVSAYGLYQAKVELPELQARFLRNPAAGAPPGEPARRRRRRSSAFQDRLLGSNEIFSTFGLANSLAGFLRRPAGPGAGDDPPEPGRTGRQGLALDRDRDWRRLPCSACSSA